MNIYNALNLRKGLSWLPSKCSFIHGALDLRVIPCCASIRQTREDRQNEKRKGERREGVGGGYLFKQSYFASH